MSLGPGTRFGPYEILSPLGAGGMGEVYRATDTALGRQVAIKVLPEAFAQDVERLARFEREAKALAALNHPHIAQIYGLERSGRTPALVMELVDGDTLAERIARGPIPLDEALPIARQIAEALETAHEQGIIHRDLKPANIKVRSDGAVKVLDFGLAKLQENAPNVPNVPNALSMSPTITSPAMATMSGVGVLLGTAAYMAPEQASGRAVDKRADIWAFGVVFWEMLTGRQLFDGETVSHVLAAILTRAPDLSVVPERVRPLLGRCLEKDPKKRLRDIGDAMSLVREDETGPTRSTRWVGVAGWVAAGAMATALGMAAWSWPPPAPDAGPASVVFQVERLPDVYARTTTAFAVSPDGSMLVYYGAGENGPQTLLVRTLATGEVKAVRDSASAVAMGDSVFWSPDSRQFVRGTASGGQVFDVTTGAGRRLCDCRYAGGSWNADGTILLGAFGNDGGITRVSLSDPTRVAVTTVDAARGERDTWPVFLPDSRHFLFTRATPGQDVATFVGSLDGGAPTRIIEGSQRIFVPAEDGRSAHLLGLNPAGVVAHPFDVDTLQVTGPPVTIVSGVVVAVSGSRNGVLATSAVGIRPRTIPTWFDRTGNALGQTGDAASIESLALSPDGRKLVSGESAGDFPVRNDVWLRDLVTGARSRVTFNGGSSPVWSPDGTRIAFSAVRGAAQVPLQRAADGTGSEAPLFPYDQNAWVNDWSSDGHSVIFSTPSAGNIGNDLWFVSMDGGTGGKPVPYLVAPALQQQAQFSPDGRFVAYASDQSGTWEIYVQTFPNPNDGKWLVSNSGGVEPRWSRDGKELFYFSGQTLMAVPVSMRPTFSNGVPMALFEAPIQPGYTSDGHRWQLAPDGKRFLLLANAGKDEAAPVRVIVNWPALLKP